MWIAAVIGTAATVYSVASAPGMPQQPDLARASVETANAQAAALPIQRQLAAAEQQGGIGPAGIGTHPVESQEVFVPGNRNGQHGQSGPSGEWIPYVPADWQPGGQYYNHTSEGTRTPQLRSTTTQAPNEGQNFAGYGTADIEGRLAQQYADIQKSLSDKYGVQFAQQAAADLRLADPQGTAARDAEYQMIQDSLTNPPPTNPLSGELQTQIDSQLKAGRGLDPMSKDLLNQAVTKANAARGGNTSAADVETAMTTGNAGQARLQAAEQKAGGFLGSGVTPADIEYRREQQNLANLGAFIGGQTPESQFPSLSTAGTGAAPFVPGQQQPTLPANAGASGGPYSVSAYNAQVRQGLTQTPSWMAGLSAALNAGSTAIQAT